MLLPTYIISSMMFSFLPGSESLLMKSVTLCVCLLAMALSFSICNRYLHPLSGIPCPFWGSITKIYSVSIISAVLVKGLELHRESGEQIQLIDPSHMLIIVSVVVQRSYTPSCGMPLACQQDAIRQQLAFWRYGINVLNDVASRTCPKEADCDTLRYQSRFAAPSSQESRGRCTFWARQSRMAA